MYKLISLFAVSSISVFCFATTRYVAPIAAGSANGSSWGNASASLQAMVDSSLYGDTLWVAAGTYFPTHDPFGDSNPTDPRDKTFYLKNGVTLLGSFAGTETNIAQRTLAVITANATILSGDIGVVNDSTDNCYHVVVSVSDDSTTVLDGFTITRGHAYGTGFLFIETYSLSRTWGAGMANNYTATTVRNVVLVHNHTASLGGGMYNHESPVTVENCVFAFNTSMDHGGGMHNEFAANINVRNSIFFKNRSDTGGGILNEINAVLNVTNCVFAGNFATTGGGGLRSDSTIMKNCVVYGNNLPPDMYPTNITYSIIEGANVFAGTGNSNAYPAFLDSADGDGADNIWRTADDGLQILPCSPAVDAGTITNATAADILGNARYNVPGTGTTAIDMGAYENTQNALLFNVILNTDTLSVDTAGLSYQWLSCPGLLNAPGVSNNQTYIAAAPGSYAVAVTDGNCTYTSACVSVGETAIREVDAAQALWVFPNPATNELNWAAGNGAEQIRIFNANGQKVMDALTHTGKLNISTLAPGIYGIQLTSANGKTISAQRFIKQ